MALTSIFISRNKADVPLLSEKCSTHGWKLTALSLIDFKAIPFTIHRPYEVVFFSSARAVEYFFHQQKLSAACSIACIGKKTAQILVKNGYTVDFIGKSAGNPEQIAKDFVTWLGDKTVLIPQSNVSNRTISKAVPTDQLIEVVAYDTIALSQQIEAHDLYIFSSPSNFVSYLEKNPLPTNKVIAWGQTTKKSLQKSGIDPVYTLETATEEELIDWLDQNELLFRKP